MNERRAAILFLVPGLAVILLFFLIPVCASLLLSITDFDIYALADLHNVRIIFLRNYSDLLSNALFAMAAQLGWRILERHGHTLDGAPVPDAHWGLDATVFWPYVDLRFAPREGQVRLEVSVRSGVLHLRARGTKPLRGAVELESIDGRTVARNGLLFRENRVRLRLIDDTGATVAEEIIADNRKQLRAPGEIGTSCLDCGETRCHLRDRAFEGIE